SSSSDDSSIIALKRTFEIRDDQSVSLRLSGLGLGDSLGDTVRVEILLDGDLAVSVRLANVSLNAGAGDGDGGNVYSIELVDADRGCWVDESGECPFEPVLTLSPPRYEAMMFGFSIRLVSSVPVSEVDYLSTSSAEAVSDFAVIVRPTPNTPTLILNTTSIMGSEELPFSFAVLAASTPDRDGSEVIEVGIRFNGSLLERLEVDGGSALGLLTDANRTSSTLILHDRNLSSPTMPTHTVAILPRRDYNGNFTIDVFVRSIELETGEMLEVTQSISVTIIPMAVAASPSLLVYAVEPSIVEDGEFDIQVYSTPVKSGFRYLAVLIYPNAFVEGVAEINGSACTPRVLNDRALSICEKELPAHWNENVSSVADLQVLSLRLTPVRKLSGSFAVTAAVLAYTEDIDPDYFFDTDCFMEAVNMTGMLGCRSVRERKSMVGVEVATALTVLPQAEASVAVIAPDGLLSTPENGNVSVTISNLTLLDTDGSEVVHVSLQCPDVTWARVQVNSSGLEYGANASYPLATLSANGKDTFSIQQSVSLTLWPMQYFSGVVTCEIVVEAVDKSAELSSVQTRTTPLVIYVTPVSTQPMLSSTTTRFSSREDDSITTDIVSTSLVDRDGSEVLYLVFDFGNRMAVIDSLVWVSSSPTNVPPITAIRQVNGSAFMIANGATSDTIGRAVIQPHVGFSGVLQWRVLAFSIEKALVPPEWDMLHRDILDQLAIVASTSAVIEMSATIQAIVHQASLLVTPSSLTTKPLERIQVTVNASTVDQDGSEKLLMSVTVNSSAVLSVRVSGLSTTDALVPTSSNGSVDTYSLEPSDRYAVYKLNYTLEITSRADFVGFFTVTVVVWSTELETGERATVSQVATVVVVPIDPVVQPMRVVHGVENAFVRLPLRRLDTSTEVASREHLLLYVPDSSQVSDVYAGLHRVSALSVNLGSVAVYAIPYALRDAISIRAREYLVGYVRVYFVLSTVPFSFDETNQSAYQDTGDGITMDEMSVVVYPAVIEPTMSFVPAPFDDGDTAVQVASKPVAVGVSGVAVLDALNASTTGGMWSKLLVSPARVVDVVWSNTTARIGSVNIGGRWFDEYWTRGLSNSASESGFVNQLDWRVVLRVSPWYSGTLSSRVQLTAVDVAKQSSVSSYMDVRRVVVGEAEVARLDVGDGSSVSIGNNISANGSNSSSSSSDDSSIIALKRTFEIRDDQSVSFRLSELGLAAASADLLSISILVSSELVDQVLVNGTANNPLVSEQAALYNNVAYKVYDTSQNGCGFGTKCSLESTVTIVPRKYLSQRFSFGMMTRSAVVLVDSTYRSLSSVSGLETFVVNVKPVPNAPVLLLNASNVTTLEDTAAAFSILDARLVDTDGSEVLEVGLSIDPYFVSAVRVNGTLVPVSSSGVVMISNRTSQADAAVGGNISILPRMNFGGKFAVEIFARSIELATGESVTVSQRVNISVVSVPDPPVLVAGSLEYRVNENVTCEVNLSSVALVDTDGSETLYLVINDTKAFAIERVENRSGVALQRTSSGVFSLSSLPAASSNLTLRFVPAASWFGPAQITITAISRENDTGATAETSQSIVVIFTPLAEKPTIAVENTRQSFGSWGKVGITNITLPNSAKANVTTISLYLQPRTSANQQVMAQNTLLQLESIPSVSTSDLYRVPQSANLSELVARSSDKSVDSLVFDVIAIAAVQASNTSQRATNSTRLGFAAIQLSATNFTLKEGDMASVTVNLLSAPLTPVVISIATSLTTKATITPSSITFSTSDWNTSRVLQITAVNNFIEDANQTVSLTSTVSSTDLVYASYAVDPITVLVVNDDVSSIAVFQKVVSTAPVLVAAEGRVFSASYSIVLLSEPTANVGITIAANLSQLVVVPTSATFTPLTWNISQQIVVYADDNNVKEGDHYGSLTHTVTTTDKIYGTKTIDPLRVMIVETKDATPPPNLESVKFLATGVGLTVQFDRSVNRSAFKDNTFLCSVIFDLPTAQSNANYFGASPSCSWQSNDASIRFLFGQNVTVVPGGILSLRGGLLKSTATAELSTPAANITIGAPDSPPVPVALVSGANSLGTCDDLFLDGSSSSGSGGRTMNFKWILTGSTNTVTSVGKVNSVLADTSTANNASLRIPAAVMEEDAVYQIILQVRNFFGAASNSSAITVKKAAMPLPVVSIKGGGKQDAMRAKELTITAAAENPTCTAPSSNGSTTAASTSVDMTFSWSQLQGDLAPAQFKSTSPNPRILKLPSRTLTVGVKYVFQIFVAMASNAKVNNTASVEVNVLPSPVSAVIGGGDRSYGVEQSLVLDASKSVDPDDVNNTVPFTYTWGCMMQSTTGTGAPYDTNCVAADTTPLVLAQLAQTTIPASTLNPNKYYNFTVTAKKDARSSSTSVVYFFKPGSPPGVSIEPLTVAKVNVNDRVVLKGTVTSKLPVTKTEWTIVGLTVAEQAAIFAVPALGRRTMLLKEYSLTPGIPYKFQLYAEDSAGQSATSSMSVVANSPPSSGLLVVTPAKGFSLDDTFTCVASNWVDEDSPLKYTYKYIKGSAYSGGDEISMGPASLDPYFSSVFTQGSGDNNTITVVVYVQDSLGAVTRVYQEIVVEQQVVAAADQAAYLANKTNAILAGALSGDPAKVMNLISALGDLINGADETPATATTATTPVPTTSAPGAGSTTPAVQVKLKSCPVRNNAQCNSKGDCIRDPVGCLETDVSCIATCSCVSGYYGDNCAMDQAQFDAKQKALGSLISAMATSSKSIDLSDVGAMEQQAASIATLTKSANVLDTASQALALSFVDNIMSAPVLTKSATTAVASTISNLLDVDSSSPTPAASSTQAPAAARRLASAGAGSSSSAGSGTNAGDAGAGTNSTVDPNEKAKKRLVQLQGTIGKLESALLSSAVAGEAPVTLVSKNLKIVATRDRASQLEGTAISIPLTAAEIAANYTPPSATVPEGFSSFLTGNSSSSSAGSSSDSEAADPTIDIQSTVYTKNPYSFDGSTMNSRVMSVKVRRDGEDVAVHGLPAPFRIMLRNADPVFASAANNSSQGLAPQNYTFYCNKDTIDTKFFDCTGLNSPISVTCNGTEFNGVVTCPVREPACRYWDTTNSSWSSQGCTVAGTTDDGQYTICECTHLTDFSTNVQQSLKLVTEHFDRVIHHVVTVEDIKKNIALLIVIGAFFALYVIGFFYVSRWDHQDTLRFKREKRMKLQQTETIKIRSLFQEPEFLHAVGWKAKLRAAITGFWRGLKENHKLMSIVFRYNEHFSRAQRLTVIFTVIMSQMFTNALLYQLKKGKKSLGSAFVAGVISSLCMVPVTIAFIAMFKKSARRQNYLVRYHVEDDEGNVAEVETDAYGNPHEYSPSEILSMDLAAIANCITISRIQRVADELKSKGVDSKVGQLCRGIFVALYHRDADDEPPEVDEAQDAENDPLKGILVQIKSHLQADLQARSSLSDSSKSRLNSLIPFAKKRKSADVVSIADVEASAKSDKRSAAELSASQDMYESGVSEPPPLSKAERRTLALNQMLLMLCRDGGEAMINDMLKFDPLQVTASSAAKIAETSAYVESAIQEEDEDDGDGQEQESEAVEVMLTLQDWLVKCHESCVAQQTNTKMVVAKARLELQRTESQLKKLKHAIGAQFERRISEAIARADIVLPGITRELEATEVARRQSAVRQDGVVVQLPVDRKKSTRRMSRLGAQQHKQGGPSRASAVVDRKLSTTIRMEKKAILKANSDVIKEKRAAMKDAQRRLMAEQRKIRSEAKKEMQKLYAGLVGVAKMKKKLQLYLEAREKKRVDALPLHERQAYLVEKEQLKKIKRTSRVLYNQFLRRQPARTSKPLFPEWVIYISYAICFGWSVWSAFFVIMFGFTIGQVESQLWVSSLLTGIAMTHVVSDPLKIFFRMGLMPIVAAGVLAESGLFNALSSETLALGAVAAVGASGVAQYMSKRDQRKRIKRAKTNRLVPTDKDVYVQALAIAGRIDSDSEGETEANKQDSGVLFEVSNRRGSFTDIAPRTVTRDTEQKEQEKRLKIEAELQADLCAEGEKEQPKLPKLVVTKGPPRQLVQQVAESAVAPLSSPMAKPKTLEQQSTTVLKAKSSVVSVFGPSTTVRKPPPMTGIAAMKPSRVAVSNVVAEDAGAQVRASVAAITHLCPCGESVREQDWTAHQQDVCQRRMVQCRAGCGMFLEARSRNGHELSQCRLVMCNCGKMVLTKSLELHQQRDCRNKTVFCRLNCGASMPSHQRERHERHECALRITTCLHCGVPRHATEMSAHLATECHVERSRIAITDALNAYSSPSASAPPRLNVAAIRGPPIQAVHPSATRSSKVAGPVLAVVVPPGGIADSDAPSVSPEKQKLAAMREKVLARKARQQAGAAAVAPSQPTGSTSSDLVSHPEETRGPRVALGSRAPMGSASQQVAREAGTLSPIRRKMMAGSPPVPMPAAEVLSPREDEVLAAASQVTSFSVGGEGTRSEAHGVGDQLDELDSIFFDASGGDETEMKRPAPTAKESRR
ncbi:hypothetical protein Gpo141_00011603, partial [Globisporangium polare]